MVYTAKTYAEALHLALSESKPEMADAVIENLVALLKADNKLDLYASIIEEFELLAGQENLKHHVEATFARESKESSKILDAVNTLVGPNMEVRSRVDDTLVGGMVLRVDDTLIDASIKGQLGRMKDNLSE